jgi:flagellar basal body rod protein FlgC
MFNALPMAVTGLYQAVARATQSANNIANASLTGKNIDEDMVKLGMAKTDVAANAAVVKAENKMDKALLDIIA